MTKKFNMLHMLEISNVMDDAKQILENHGVEIESPKVVNLLKKAGAKIVNNPNRDHPTALISEDLLYKCIDSVPEEFKMYDRFGNESATIGGDHVNYTPGSCGTNYYDAKTDTHRRATEHDLTEIVRVSDSLKNMAMVSTSVVVDQTPASIQDLYRLRIVLNNSTKPIVTGTFVDNLEAMKDMLVVVRGSEEELKKKPFAIFDCCPSPALKWPRIWGEDVMNCAKYGIPVEFISMPQPGLSSPPLLYDSVVQHTAETLSGVVISQCSNPGAPLIYGGSPTMVNHASMGMTALLGDIGTMRMDLAYISIAKHLCLPCQCYLGLSDSKRIDVQAGYEKGMSILLTAMAGVNNVSGPGMLESENCQSKEMIVIDDEICGMAFNFIQGLPKKSKHTVDDIVLMAEEKTVDPDRIQYLRDDTEFHRSKVADKEILGLWQKNGRKSMLDNAIERTEEILNKYTPNPLSIEQQNDINKIIESKQ